MTEERRETERAVRYWRQRAPQLGSGATTLDEMIADGGANRFIIAVDRLTENHVLLTYGANFARLLGLPINPGSEIRLIHEVPERFLPDFIQGCREAAPHGAPVRIEGAVERRGDRLERYRAVFMPLGGNLVLGAFNSRVIQRQLQSHTAIELAIKRRAVLEMPAKEPPVPRDEHEAAIAAFGRLKGITKCPTAFAVPTHALTTAADRAALERYAAEREQRRLKSAAQRLSFWAFEATGDD